MSETPVVTRPHGSRLRAVVQRTKAASIGPVSDVTLAGAGLGEGLVHGPGLLDVDEGAETVPRPMPDTGVGTLCVVEHAAARNAAPTSEVNRASGTRTCKARLLLEGVRPGDRGALHAVSQIVV